MGCTGFCAEKCPACIALFNRKFPKFTLFILNGIIFVGGLALLITGMFLLYLTGFLGFDVIRMLNGVGSGVTVGVTLMIVTYGMICGGGMTMIVAVSGVSCAKKKSKPGLMCYGVALLILMVVYGVTTGFWIHFRTRDGEWLEGRMLEQLKAYKGPTEFDTVSNGWNKMFIHARCCGVKTHTDFVDQDTVWANNKNPSEDIPATCCKGVTDDDVQAYVLSLCTNTPQDYYTQGCYGLMKSTMEIYSLVGYICMGGLVIAEVLAVMFVCILKEKKKNAVQPIKKAIGLPAPKVEQVSRTKFQRRF